MFLPVLAEKSLKDLIDPVRANVWSFPVRVCVHTYTTYTHSVNSPLISYSVV